MMRTKWTIRLEMLGVVVSVAVLANAAGIAATSSGAQGGAVATGVHANEAFCKTMITQADQGAEYMKNQLLTPDTTKRTKYFADQKALNATLVKTAPASLASDIARFTKESDDFMNAQQAGDRDRARNRAAGAAMSSPEHVADYCGVKMSTAK
jgi:hypothetical protein